MEEGQHAAPRAGKDCLGEVQQDAIIRRRGRPRSGVNDGEAAQQRRAQLRHAQQKFRIKREGEISALQKRVVELEAKAQRMEELFSTIYRSVKKSSLHQTEPELTMLLEESAAHFLPQGVEVESGTESHRNAFETSEPDQLQVLNDESRSSTQAPSPAHQDVIFGYRGPSQEADGAAADPSIERGDTQCISPGGLDPRYTNSNMYSQSPRTDYLVTGQGPLKTTQLNTTNFSYSFREASFSRRLHRYCLEGAYRLFIDPASDPTTVYRVFRLVHCIVDKIKMRPYFEALLRRGSGESLEISSLPFYCVGRAGTHYPMKDKSGKPTHPQNMRLSKRVLGSLPPPVTEGPDQDQRYQEFLDMMGYGGVWFDSHDVEAYLAEKGIFPESHSSHVDIQQAPSGSHLNTSSASTAALGYQTPNVADGVRGSAMAQEIHPTNGSKNLQSLLSSNAYPDLQNIAPLTQPAPTCYSTAHVCIDVTAHRSVSKKPSLFFDVQCFLDYLLRKTAFLGRAPGFRKSDVDAAINNAVRRRSP